MYRLFLKRAIALWLILSATFLTLLITDSRYVDHTPFASIEISPPSGPSVYLPNHIFHCTKDIDQVQYWLQCRASLLEQPLDIYFGSVPFRACRGRYAGTDVVCRYRLYYRTPGPQDGYTLHSDLELTTAQLDELRWRYWGKNLLMLAGGGWITGLVLSLIGGVLMALAAWHSPGWWAVGIASFSYGIGMTIFLTNPWHISSLDGMTLLRLSEVDEWAIAAGLGTWISTAALLYFPLSPIIRLVTSLLAGVSLFSLLIQPMGIRVLVVLGALPFVLLYRLVQPDEIERTVVYFADFVTGALALLAAFWLYRKRPINTRRFLSFTCGLGVFSIELLLVLMCLEWLGYID